MARYIFTRYVFLLSVTVSWFAFLSLPYLAVFFLVPSKLVDFGWVHNRHVLGWLVLIPALPCAFVGAGLYYVVGRKFFRTLGLYDDEVAELSFKQFRYYRRRYSVTGRPRRNRG